MLTRTIGFFSSPKDQIVYAIGHGVYKGLDLDQKLELCKTLLILAKEGDAAVSRALECSKIPSDVQFSRTR
jgi:hypothetical protein